MERPSLNVEGLLGSFLSNDPSPSPRAPFIKNKYGIIDLHVHVNINFLRNINTSQQTFECTLVIQFRWLETMHFGGDDDSGWRPEISFSNAANDVKIYYSKTTKVSQGNNTCQVNHIVIVNGVFAEHFELKQFPIDAQRLHVNVALLNCPIVRQRSSMEISSHSRHSPNTCPATPREIYYTQYSNDIVSKWFGQRFRLLRGDLSFSAENFMDYDSWQVIDKVEMLRSKTNPALNPDGICFCRFMTYITVQRKCLHYFWNIVFPLSLQVCLAHSTLFIRFSEIETKSQITLTLILTIFAVKFSCTQFLPVVNQMTYIDMYFVYCTFFVCLITIQNLVIYLLIENEVEYKVVMLSNFISGTIFISVWVFSQVFIYALMLSKTFRSKFIRLEIDENDDCITHDQHVVFNDADANRLDIVDKDTLKHTDITFDVKKAHNIISFSTQKTPRLSDGYNQ